MSFEISIMSEIAVFYGEKGVYYHKYKRFYGGTVGVDSGGEFNDELIIFEGEVNSKKVAISH